MSSLHILLLSAMLLGQTAAQERNSGKFNMKCDWLKKEMAKGAKPWLAKQRWYARVAQSCGMPVMISNAEAPPSMLPPLPAMEEPAKLGLRGQQPQKLAQLAKMALADSASQHKAKTEAMKLAQMAKMALMKNPDAQAGMKKGMEILKAIEENKKDGSLTKDADFLANKAKGNLRNHFGPIFEGEATSIVDRAQELLKRQDIQNLGSDAIAFLNNTLGKHKDLADETSKLAQIASAKMQGAENEAAWEQAMPFEEAMEAPCSRGWPCAMREAAMPVQYGVSEMRAMPTRETIQV